MKPTSCLFPGSESSLAPFSVSWNGRPLAVHFARVSAVPYNRVWNGTQRPLDQTEPAAFVSFDMDGPGELEIRADAGDPPALPEPHILPLSFPAPCHVEDGVVRIVLDRPRQLSLLFGSAAPTLHVFANPPFALPSGNAEDAAPPDSRTLGLSDSPGPSALSVIHRFGPGEHDVGVIVARSGETIVVEEGAVVYGTILVANAHDVRVVGRGIVDGSRLFRADHDSAAFRAAVEAGLPPSFYGAEMAVNGLTVYASERVAVEGVIFRDPPRWAVIVRGGSRDVLIDNVKIVGCWRYNSDGIDVCSSERVTIRDCFIRSFDDCLVARGAYLENDGPVTRGVVAERCVLWCDWGKCMEVWAGPKPCLIENVRFRDNAVVHPSGTVCDVTTWFGSSDTRIRDIAFEGTEVDFAGPLWKEKLQVSDEEPFPLVPREAQRLLVVNVERYGRYLGNQQFEPATDLSGFRVRYEDIAVRGIRCHGEAPRLVGTIDSSSAPHTLSGLDLKDLPPSLDLNRMPPIRP